MSFKPTLLSVVLIACTGCFAAAARGELRPGPEAVSIAPIRAPQDLRMVSIPNTTIESVRIDPDDGSCRLTAIVTHPPANDRVRVFIALPMKGWNGRFRGTGGSGWAGGSAANLGDPVHEGWAAGATDTGHVGGSGSFALAADGRLDWQAIRDNAYLGIHDMTVVGKALATAFYGTPPRHSYFMGGSTGGRQALMEAQRFPADYDGIVALFPSIHRNRYVPAQLWPQVVMREAGNFVPKAKLAAVTAAAVAACDGADGVIDGVIADPIHCAYDPEALVGTTIGGSIFTEADAKVVRAIWKGPRAQDGKFLWYGPTPGADLSVLAGTTGTPLAGKPLNEGIDWFRYFIFRDPAWDWKTLTPAAFELAWNQSVEEYGAVFGSDDPDLTGFRDHEGRVIIAHGLADQIVPPEGTIDYFREVERRMGGAKRTAEFARLFLVPGAGHGFKPTVPVPSQKTMLDAIVRWVERGQAPDRIGAEMRDAAGAVIRARPVFPYPQVAKYTGSGSTNDAANFVSTAPEW